MGGTVYLGDFLRADVGNRERIESCLQSGNALIQLVRSGLAREPAVGEKVGEDLIICAETDPPHAGGPCGPEANQTSPQLRGY